MARSGIKGYDVLLTDDVKPSAEYADKTKDKIVTATLIFLNRTFYKKLLLYQEGMVWFYIVK